MCGSLRRENQDKLVGGGEPSKLVAQWGGRGEKFTIVTKDGKQEEATFNGHAQQESLQNSWTSKGWESADLRVTGYTEANRQYEIPKGYVISVVTRHIPGHGRIFNIVTREARGAEKDVHSRFPVLRHPLY